MTAEKCLKSLLDWGRDRGQVLFGEKKLSHLHNFLMGYRFARSQFNIPQTPEELELDKFDRWVREKFHGSLCLSWEHILDDKFGKDAWDKFYELLDEFRSGKPARKPCPHNKVMVVGDEENSRVETVVCMLCCTPMKRIEKDGEFVYVPKECTACHGDQYLQPCSVCGQE